MPLFTAGLALTVGGSLWQMQAQRRQSAYAAEMAQVDAQAQADALRYNAELGKINAEETARVAHENRRLGLMEISRGVGKQRARTVARGVSVGSATAQDIRYEMALMGEYQLNETFRARMTEAYGFSGQAMMKESQARFTRARGRQQAGIALAEGRSASYATALTGATNVALMSDRHMQATGRGPYAPIVE